MKLHRILSLPFTALLDAATLGNIGGDRSFTQQVFDAEQYEQEKDAIKDFIKALKD